MTSSLPPPARNRTSEAVQRLNEWLVSPGTIPAEGWDLGPPKPEFTLTLDEMGAIAKKYKRMEEALQEPCPACTKVAEQAATSGTFIYTEACSKCQACSRALAFDPLSSDGGGKFSPPQGDHSPSPSVQ